MIRIFYLIVDPTFVTLAGIPLLLMDVVPRLNNMRLCLLAAVDTVLQTTAVCIPSSFSHSFVLHLPVAWQPTTAFDSWPGCWQSDIIASRLTKLDVVIGSFVHLSTTTTLMLTSRAAVRWYGGSLQGRCSQ